MLKTIGNPSTRYGDQTIVNGNLVIGTSGKGIDFAASGGTVLDDYEEGTFTPSLNSAGGAVSTLSANGSYTKIGDLVTFNLYVNFNIGTATGALSVGLGALPAQKTGTDASTWAIVYSRGFLFPANTTALYGYKYPSNANALLLWQNITGAGGSSVDAGSLTGVFGSMEIMVSGSYLAN